MFAIKVIMVFVVVEAIACTFGHFETETIAMILLAGPIILFAAAFFNVRRKDKKQKTDLPFKQGTTALNSQRPLVLYIPADYLVLHSIGINQLTTTCTAHP